MLRLFSRFGIRAVTVVGLGAWLASPLIAQSGTRIPTPNPSPGTTSAKSTPPAATPAAELAESPVPNADPAAPESLTPSDGRAPEETLASPWPATLVFASLERAWVIGNVDSVVGHFGKRKVHLSLPDGGPQDGVYSRNQSYFIFKDLFDGTRTEGFSFVAIRRAEDQPGTAIGRAERTFRRRGSSRLVQDRIFVSLVQEDARWVVAEIKSVR